MPIDRGAKEAQEAKKFRAGLSPKPPVRAAPAVRSVSNWIRYLYSARVSEENRYVKCQFVQRIRIKKSVMRQVRLVNISHKN